MIKKGKTLKDSVFSCKSICVCICLIQNYRDTKFIDNNNGAHQEKIAKAQQTVYKIAVKKNHKYKFNN